MFVSIVASVALASNSAPRFGTIHGAQTRSSSIPLVCVSLESSSLVQSTTKSRYSDENLRNGVVYIAQTTMGRKRREEGARRPSFSFLPASEQCRRDASVNIHILIERFCSSKYLQVKLDIEENNHSTIYTTRFKNFYSNYNSSEEQSTLYRSMEFLAKEMISRLESEK